MIVFLVFGCKLVLFFTEADSATLRHGADALSFQLALPRVTIMLCPTMCYCHVRKGAAP